jgi:hypothetical protein
MKNGTIAKKLNKADSLGVFNGDWDLLYYVFIKPYFIPWLLGQHSLSGQFY